MEGGGSGESGVSGVSGGCVCVCVLPDYTARLGSDLSSPLPHSARVHGRAPSAGWEVEVAEPSGGGCRGRRAERRERAAACVAGGPSAASRASRWRSGPAVRLTRAVKCVLSSWYAVESEGMREAARKGASMPSKRR